MKVTHLTDRYMPAVGGVETHVWNLCRNLGRLGVVTRIVTTRIYTVSPFRLLPENAFSPDVTLRRGFRILPLPQGLGVLSPCMIADMEGEIIHAHGYGRFPTFLWWEARAKSKKFVVTTHSDAGRAGFAKKLYDSVVPEFSIKHADALIALTNHEKEYLVSLGVKEEKVRIIPNGVDLEEASRFRQRVKAKPDQIIFAGRMDIEHKGLDILLKAFSILASRGHNLKLILAGPEIASSYRRLVKMAEALCISKNVKLVGPLRREDLLHAIAESSMLILPSRFEPFGIVILEAMSLGTPVVASRVGGIPEVIPEGSGLLCNPNDPHELASCMEELLTDEKKRYGIAQKALQRVRDYSWERIAGLTLKLYKEL